MTPLQKFEISQLKLVAIISLPEGNIALVEDGTGKGYFVKKGTLIGKNDGKVTKILKDKVLIEEVYQDVLGQEVSVKYY
jgi:type IV pilus assembly protein PilP